MTIGSPSGSGATQSDIADGVEESQARTQKLINAGLVNQSPNRLSVSGSGATPAFDESGLSMGSGNSGDEGAAVAGNSRIFSSGTEGDATILIKARYVADEPQSNLNDEHAIGMGVRGFESGIFFAVFRPHVGDNTSGNVYVESNSGTTTKAISYPDIQKLHNYTVLLDYSGEYLNSNHTGFYIDADPRKGDSPNADISDIPEASGDDRSFGLFYTSTGNDQPMGCNHLEVSIQ